MPKLKINPLYILGSCTALSLDKHNRSVDDGRIRAMVGVVLWTSVESTKEKIGKKIMSPDKNLQK